MSGLSRLRSLWRNVIHRKRVERDLDDELRSVFEALVNEHVQAGIRPEEARRAATVQLGRIDSIKTQLREERSGAGLESLWHDVRFGARMLRRSPLFTFTAVLSLAIGIGANTTMFSLVNALLLRDLPVADPQQLVEFWRTTQFGAGTAFSYPAYEKLRDENSAFTGVLAMSKSTVAGAGVSGQSAGRFVSGNFFEVLGLTPRAGRLLSAHDDRPDAPEGSAVAVISNRLWQLHWRSSRPVLPRRLEPRPERQVERSLATERLIARLLSAFAVLALVLASVGLYGVLGYSVARRTGEIGLRLALGATRSAVLRSVLRQSLIVVTIGSAAGIPAAMLSARSLSSLLYGVTSSDVRVLGGAVASLLAVATIAAAFPAWRASRVDPLVALRHE